ncbi:MAG: response regulator [Burkholderiales bacterium]|nr:response regulator [Anaerolineae bacterium]
MTQPHALIIDDNSKNLGVLSRMLAKQGVTCTEMQNPAQLEAFMANTPHIDVAFIDLELPNISGYEILNLLRSDGRFDNVPLVAYTVHISEINTALKEGFHSFLGKPLDATRFPDQLQRILRGEQVWEAA